MCRYRIQNIEEKQIGKTFYAHLRRTRMSKLKIYISEADNSVVDTSLADINRLRPACNRPDGGRC